MFSNMLHALTEGKIPEKNELARRLSAALVKKMAILRQPYLFWSTDSKINPPARHILWATLLLEDFENFNLAGDILLTEKLESGAGSKSSTENPENLRKELINADLTELLKISKDDFLNEQLRTRITAMMK